MLLTASGESFLEVLSSAQCHKYELWLKAGQSNSVGNDHNGQSDPNGLDKPHPRIMELSRGKRKSTHRVPDYGYATKLIHPAQDDGTNVSAWLDFAKARLALNPSIERILIVNRGVGGTGFAKGNWNPGDDEYNLAVDDMNLALRNYPQFVPTGILWHQGEADRNEGQAFYESALSTMVQSMRSDIANGSGMMFICGTMVESWIAENEAEARPIDLAHRNVSNYIPCASCVDLSDLTDLNDLIHFSSDSLRIIGRRMAESAQSLSAEIRDFYRPHRVKVINGQAVDLYSDATIDDPVKIVHDLERGAVIDTDDWGNSTGLELNPTEYTKALWVKLKTSPDGYGHLISGGLGNNGTPHYFGKGGLRHGSSASYFKTELNNALTVGAWVHLVATFKDGTFTLYINGAQAGQVSGIEDVQEPVAVEIGTMNGLGRNQIDALLDDIVILPYAVDDSGAMRLFNG